jgi:hypothetical protein
MQREEAMEIIVNIQHALENNRMPDFNDNLHRVRQLLRILQVDYWNFEENEHERACNDETRNKWEKFWDNKQHKKDLECEVKRLLEFYSDRIKTILYESYGTR